MDDGDELLLFDSDDEQQPLDNLAVDVEPILELEEGVDEQQSAERSASRAHSAGGRSQLTSSSSGEQQQQLSYNYSAVSSGDGLVAPWGEHEGQGARSRLDEDDWIISDAEDSPQFEYRPTNIASRSATPQRHLSTSQQSQQTPRGSTLGAEASPVPPLPSQPPFSQTAASVPPILPIRLPTIDDIIDARPPLGVDRANTIPRRQDDLFDLAPEPFKQRGSIKRGTEDDQYGGKRRRSEASSTSAARSSRESEAVASASCDTSQMSGPERSVKMPILGDRFPSRHALLTRVSCASHSLGYRAKILRYPNSLSSSVKIGCPLHMPARSGRCPANLNAAPRGDEMEITMLNMAHNHDGEDLGAWVAPRAQGVAKVGRGKRKGRKSQALEGEDTQKVEPASIDDAWGSTEFEHVVAPASLATAPASLAPAGVENSPHFHSLAPAAPFEPLNPHSNDSPSSFTSTGPLPSQSHTFYIYSQDVRQLDDPIAQALGSSTTSAPLVLEPSQPYFPLPPLPKYVHSSRAPSPVPFVWAANDNEEGGADVVEEKPSKAEMDALFGFETVAASIEADVIMAEPDALSEEESEGVRFSMSQKGKGRACQDDEGGEGGTSDQGEEEDVDGVPVVVKEEEEEPQAQGDDVDAEPYQLQPIPAVSEATGEPLTAEEKRLAIIDALEHLAVSVLEQIVEGVLPRPATGTSQTATAEEPKSVVIVLAKRGGVESAEITDPKTRRLVFPRLCGGQKDSPIRLGGRELAAFLKVVETILDGLKSRTVSTKRDIFYRSVSLFVKQQVVDSIVEDIAATLRVRRGELNVVAASKGLFAGHLKLHTTDGITLEGGSQGALIPPVQMIDELELDEVKWVLIIEKEAVFHSLCSPDFLAHELLPHGLLLTGKGYPDLSTRELIRRLADEHPDLPLLCLVDADPHGLEIMSTYKYGSASLSFDRANLAVEGIKWLGVKGSEWDAMGVPRGELLPLTMADRKKAIKMCKREGIPEEWRRELEYMLHLQRKAEIQVLLSAATLSTSGASQSQATASQPSQLSSTSAGSSRAPSRLVEYVVDKLRKVVE